MFLSHTIKTQTNTHTPLLIDYFFYLSIIQQYLFSAFYVSGTEMKQGNEE